jgi:hypothetical protein
MPRNSAITLCRSVALYGAAALCSNTSGDGGLILCDGADAENEQQNASRRNQALRFLFYHCHHFTKSSFMISENGIGVATLAADPVFLVNLFVVAALGYVFHSFKKRLGAWGAMNSSIEYIVPGDVGIEVMFFGLLFEESFEFSQFFGILFG